MKTKNLILTSLIIVAAIPVFAAGVQNGDPYTNGQAVTEIDPYMDDAHEVDVYTNGAVCKANPYMDGALREVDPYIDDALVDKADPFTDGQ